MLLCLNFFSIKTLSYMRVMMVYVWRVIHRGGKKIVKIVKMRLRYNPANASAALQLLPQWEHLRENILQDENRSRTNTLKGLHLHKVAFI